MDSFLNFFIKRPDYHASYSVVCLFIVTFTVLWAFISIIGHGFFPPDDALRHVGQAVCQQPWQEILVINQVQNFDVHFGWQKILYFLADHGVSKIELLHFSVLFFLVLNFFVPAFLTKRPEIWALSIIIGLCLFTSITRFSLGRPFLAQVSAVTVLGLSSQHFKEKFDPRYILFLFLFLTMAISLRALWFIFVLPISCFLFAGKYKQFLYLTIVWICSTLVSALLSGDFISFLIVPFISVLSSTGRDLPSWMLVGELVPTVQPLLFFIPIVLFILWRKSNGREIRSRIYNPMFILILISWVLSMKINRFWADFAVPAYFVWLYEELEEIYEKDLNFNLKSIKRIGVCFAVCVPLWLIISGDFNGRWSRSIYTKAPDITEKDTRDWLPDEGGIFYNTSMGLFYKTFYANPDAPWKYFLGPEAAAMPEDNLDIYHQIVLSFGAKEKLQLIVDKMTPKDRFVLENGNKPDIDGLEWFEIKPDIWSGRLPKSDDNKDRGKS